MNLREDIRKFIDEIIKPKVREIDKKDVIPKELLEKMIEKGFTTLCIPKKYGGLELDETNICVITEEVGYTCPAIVPFLEIHMLFSNVLLLGGTEEQKEKYFKRIVNGDIACYALTDEGAGSDPSAMKSTAEKTQNGYLIKGKKRYITFADLADIFVVFAKTGDKISAFIVDGVEKGRGIKLEKHMQTMGLRGHRAYDLSLNVEVPKDNLIGGEGNGLRLALETLNRTRISLACGYIGLARASLDSALKFAKERYSMGKPIIEHQAVGFALAEIATQIEAARLLAYKAAEMSERGEKHRKETSMAKFYAGEVMLKATTTASRILGGFGCAEDFLVEKYVRDAYSWIFAQGAPEIQKLTILREL